MHRDRIFTLPSEEVLLERFRNKAFIHPEMLPHLLENAGEERTPLGFVLNIMMAISQARKTQEEGDKLMLELGPEIIDLMIDDEETKMHTKNLIKNEFSKPR